MALLESKTEFTGIESRILSNSDRIFNKELIDLVKSGLINKDVISYSEESFLFETKNIIMPKFIWQNFTKEHVVLGTSIPFHTFLGEARKQITDKFFERLNSHDKMAQLKDCLGYDKIVKRLIENGKESTVQDLNNLFDKKFSNMFSLGINILADQDACGYFELSLAPKIEIEKFLSDYIEAVVHLNKSYRIKLEFDKLAYCPIDNLVGEEILNIIGIIGKITRETLKLITTDFIQIIEEICSVSLDEYELESFRTNGIKKEVDSLIYFNEIVNPTAMGVLIKNVDNGKYIFGQLKEYLAFLPKESKLKDIDDYLASHKELDFLQSYF